MQTTTMQLIILSLFSGIFIGAIVTMVFIRAFIKNKIKPAKIKQPLKLNKSNINDNIKERKENLVLIAQKLKNIEKNIKKINTLAQNNYINDLNNILGTKGIAPIKKDNI